MTYRRRNILIMFAGCLVSIIVISALLFVGGFFFLFHKSYFPIPKLEDYLLIYGASLFIGFIVYFLYTLFKKRYKYFAKGILVSILFSLGIFIFNTYDFIWFLTPESFNEGIWKSSKEKPLEMVYSLIRDDANLIGKTKKEAIQILGIDYIMDYTDENQLTYKIEGYKIAYFQLSFTDSGKVEKVYYTYYD